MVRLGFGLPVVFGVEADVGKARANSGVVDLRLRELAGEPALEGGDVVGVALVLAWSQGVEPSGRSSRAGLCRGWCQCRGRAGRSR